MTLCGYIATIILSEIYRAICAKYVVMQTSLCAKWGHISKLASGGSGWSCADRCVHEMYCTICIFAFPSRIVDGFAYNKINVIL